MSKKFFRSVAMLLCVMAFLQLLPSDVLGGKEGLFKSTAASVSGGEFSAADFSTNRLLVGTSDPSLFPEDANIISEYEGGVYLIGFENASETESAYKYYSEAAEFVDADIALFIADDDYIGVNRTVEGLQGTPDAEYAAHYDIALIDTGAYSSAASADSVIGGDGVDDNGHGSAMYDAIASVSDSVSVLSIKAFDSRGVGYLSDVYAAVLYALEQDVDVISMSFAAEKKTSGAVLRHALDMAKEAGVIVVAAAGNEDKDASGYIPGCFDDIYVVGACDENGVKRETSNYGSSVVCNIVSEYTSEAAAKAAALIAARGEGALKAEMNKGLVFDKNYGYQSNEIIPDMLIMDDDDGDTVYEKHYMLVKTEPSEDHALLKNLKPLSGINGNKVYPLGGEELPGTDPDIDWSVPPAQEPTVGDTATIERIYVRWLTSSEESDAPAYFGLLDLEPKTDSVRNQQFQIDFALSGQQPYEAGMVQIVLPAVLWLDRDGNMPGALELAIPEDPNEGAEFVWKRDGDNIVITNAKTLSAASKVMIQGHFAIDAVHTMEDDTLSNPFSATVRIVTMQGDTINTIEKESNTIYAHINTYIEATYANKTAYNSASKTYDVWWEELPPTLPQELLDDLPGDPSDYGYVRWYVSGTAQGNQPFDMYVKDTVDDLYGGIMLGASSAFKTEQNPDGVYHSPDGKSVEALLYSGYSTDPKTAYVWTAYPKDKMPPEQVVTIPNTQTISVVGQDNGEESQKSASAYVTTKLPTIYTFVKYWDDNDDEMGVRPDYMYLRIYRSGYSSYNYWKRIQMNESYSKDGKGNHWTYSWSDEGMADSFWIEEQLVNSSGTWQDKFDGSGHRLGWNYSLTKTEYDSETHTWTYTNSYDDGWIKFELSSLYKNVEYKYRDSDTISTRDSQSLNKLLRGETVYIQYPVSAKISVAQQAAWFGIKPNIFVLEDVEYSFNNITLPPEDLDIGAVYLDTPILWHYLEDSYGDDGWYDREMVTPPPATLYGLLNGKWVEMATLEDGVLTAADGSGASVSDMKVSLPPHVTRVKFQLESDVEIVELSYTVELRLRPTETVCSMIESVFEGTDYQVMPIYNKANSYAIYNGEGTAEDERHSYNKGDRITDMVDVATGYMHGRLFRVAVELDKTFKKEENDTVNRRVMIKTELKLTQQSNVLTRAEYDDLIANGEIPNSRSGVFYDLLPYGVEPDIDSVKVVSRGSVANVWTKQNYKDSGRILLVVLVNFDDNISWTNKSAHPESRSYPDEGYKNTHTITFKSYISWDVISDAATKLDLMYNVAAYEADESSVGTLFEWAGEHDDPLDGNHNNSSGAVGSNADLMKGLDPDRDDPSFVYAGSKLEYDNVNVSALTELRKHVQIVGTGLWSTGRGQNDVKVQEGGIYTYRLLINSGVDTTTSNLVLLDSIENYIPHGIDEDTGDTQWHGSLLSIDLRQVIEAGVDPVVYYSLNDNVNLDKSIYNPNDEKGAVIARLKSGADGWTTEKPDDMSKVKAIAIDMSKREDGTDFELQQNETLMVYLNMRAPYERENDNPDYFKGTDGTDYLQNAHAYNGVYLDCTQVILGVPQHNYINNNYTKVGIFTKYVRVSKVWDDMDDRDGLRPESITVHLIANGTDTGDAVVLSDENDWRDTFKRVLTYDDEGNYIVYSYEETFKYRDDYEMTVNRQVRDDGSIDITLINKHEPEKISIPVIKTWLDDEENRHNTRPVSITVRLFADGEDTGKTLTITPDDDMNWRGEFTDLYKYRDHRIEIVYTVEEEIVDDYVSEGVKDYFEKNGEAYVEGDEDDETEGEVIKGYELVNRYKPKGDLIVTKTLKNATEIAAEKEFTFWLWLETKEGEDIVDKYTYVIYDADGNETDRTGEIGNADDFRLKEGEKIVIKDMPTHIFYRVTEDDLPGFELTGTVGAKGEIISWNAAEAVLTNTYSTSGYASLVAYKHLTGHALAFYQFRFELYDGDRDNGGNLIRTVYNNAEGKATFGQIGYSNDDDGVTYTYYIYETDTQRPGYTYDDRCYMADVTPHDLGNGNMDVDIVYYYYDTENNRVELGKEEQDVFENEYHASGSLAFRAWKVLEVRAIENEEFVFDLYDQNYKWIGFAANDQDGVVNFPELSYDENDAAKVYWYYAVEREGTDTTVVYDKTILGYKVTVVDNNDGTLSFNQVSYDMTEAFTTCTACGGNSDTCSTCTGFGKVVKPDWTEPDEDGIIPVFYNGLQDGSLAVSKYIKGEGDDFDPNKEFHFKVKLIGDKVDELGDSIQFEIVAADDKKFPEVDGYIADTSNAPVVPTTPASIGITDDYAVMPLAGAGPESGVNGTVSWEIDENGKLILWPTNGVSGTLANVSNFDGSVWYENTFIKSVEIRPGVNLGAMARAIFHGCTNIKTFSGFENLGTSDTWDFYELFDTCETVYELDLSSFDTSKATEMKYMFYECYKLNKLDISSFDTSKLTNATDGIFKGVSNLFEVTIGPKTFASSRMSSFPYSGRWVAKDDINNPSADTYTSAGLRGKTGTFVWNVDCYKVNFKPGIGGSGYMDWGAAPVSSEYIVHQSRFTRGGYEVVGWQIEGTNEIIWLADGVAKIPANKYKKGDEITLVALWEKTGFSVSFEPGADGVEGEMPSKTMYMGIDFVIKSEFLYPDHELIAWRDEINDMTFEVVNGVATIPAGTYLNLDESVVGITLVAQWKSLGYTIKFEAPDGAGQMQDAVGTSSTDYDIPVSRFTRMGYRLKGWQDKAYEYDEGSPTNFYPITNGVATIPAGTYKDGDIVSLTAIWEPVNTNANIVDGEFDFTLRGGEKAIFEGLPAGTAYQVWEETPDGWVLVEQNGASGIIEPTERSEAEFYNLYQPDLTAVNIVGTKFLDKRAADSYDDTAFVFELWEELANGTEKLVERVQAQAGGFILFSTIIYKDADIGLHTYHVREVNGGHPDIQYDDSSKKVTVNVYEGDDGNLYSELTYEDGAVQFVNHVIPGRLEISKVAENMEMSEGDPDFYFKVTFFNENGAPMEGESFYWYTINSDTGEVVSIGDEGDNKAKDDENGGDADVEEPVTGLVDLVLSAAKDLYVEHEKGYEVTPLATGSVLFNGVSNTVIWEIYSDHTLVLRPSNGTSGKLGAFSGSTYGRSDAPWYPYVNYIEYVDIQGKIELAPYSNGLFAGCTKLKYLNGLENIDASKVTNMTLMFYECTSLTKLDLSSWNMQSIEVMGSTFMNSTALTELNLSGWGTDNLTNMYRAFNGCSALAKLNLSGWNTKKVSSVSETFGSVNSLSQVTIGDQSLASSSLTLPTPRNASGKWIQFDPFTKKEFTSQELRTAGAGTYVWEIPGNIIYFDSGDADITGTMNWMSVDFTGDITIPENIFERPGYELISWLDENTGKSFPVVDGVATVNAGTYEEMSLVTLTAQWEKVGYAIYFEPGANDTAGSMSYVVGVNSEDFVLPRNRFVRMGYVFSGWEDKLTGEVFTPVDGYVTILGGTYSDEVDKVTLVAQWEALEDSNTVPYYIYHYWQDLDNEESYSLADMEVKYAKPGTEVSLDVKNYKGFIAPEKQPNAVVSTDEVLRVTYKYDRVHFTVHFDGNGAELGSMDDIELTYGFRRILGNGFTKNESVFLGWNTQKDGSGIMYSAVAPVELVANNGETLNLYAQWLTLDQSFEATRGELIVHCKAGQTIVFPNLPAGTTYTIEEINIPEGWTKTSEENVSGKILPNYTSETRVSNLYSTQGVASITAHKSFEGGNIEQGMFTFELYDKNPEEYPDLEPIAWAVNGDVDIVEGTYDDETQETVPNDWYGWTPVIFDGLRFDAPGEYVYYILEKRGTEGNIDYDEHIEKVIVTMTDNGKGMLVPEIEYEVEHDGAPFENSVAKGAIKVSKTVLDATETVKNTEFGFYIDLTDAEENPVNGTFTLVLPDGTEEEFNVTDGTGGPVYIKADQSFTVEGIPDGTRYTVREANAPGFEQLDFTNASGVIKGFDTITAACKNQYIVSAVLVLEAEKTFIGGELTDGLFKFELVDDHNNVLQTADVSADGSVVFEPIVYTESDTGYHIYRIREVTEGVDGVRYDRHVSFIQVLVYFDENDDLQWKYDEATGVDDRHFTNVTVYDMTVSKTVTGYADERMNYKFVMTLENEYDIDLNEVTWSKGSQIGALSDLLVETNTGTRYEFTLMHDETITFYNLPYGTSYTVQEILSDFYGQFYITTITPSSGEVNEELRMVSGKVDDADISIAYQNHSDTVIEEFPATGGMGTKIVDLIGCLLLLAAAWLCYRKRRTNNA